MLDRRTFHGIIKYSILFFISAGVLIFTSCGEDSSAGPDEDEIEVAEIVIEPENATFEVGEEHEFSVFLISSEGDIVNDQFDVEWNWYSSDPDVFTVEPGGMAYGHDSGEAFCIVEAVEAELASGAKLKAKSAFVGRDSAFVTVLK